MAPWIEQPVYTGALHRYARAEARSRLLTAHILKVVDAKGVQAVPVALWAAANQSDNTAGRAAAELGLTPMARAKLAALTSAAAGGEETLAALLEQGRRLLEERGIGAAAPTIDVEEDAP